jgi:acyl carrier protein
MGQALALTGAQARPVSSRLFDMSNSSLGMNHTIDVAGVRAAVIETLEIQDRAGALDATTPLTAIPELDSLAIVELIVELEQRFGIEFDDDDVTAEVFETLGSLAAFVDAKSR